jgi:gamma-glutamylcyclotransferase (GGCT)/AIG2-like uncharacterized protein YtfP
MENHLAFAKTLIYMQTVRVQGYRMYSLREYPYAIHTSHANDQIVVDLFRITSIEAEEMIYKMEIDADYILSSLVIEGNKFGIYLFAGNRDGDEYLPGGDWVMHTRDQFF